MKEQPTSETKLTTWCVRVSEHECLLVSAESWECSGNGLKFYENNVTKAWFLKWEYFYEHE